MYALKVLPYLLSSLEAVTLHWQVCSSDCIVKLDSVYKTRWDDKPSLLAVMEYMKGGELYHCVPRSGQNPEHVACTITKQIVTAVDHLYRMNMVHCDLKPENFLFKSEPVDSTLKLTTHFGSAWKVTSANM